MFVHTRYFSSVLLYFTVRSSFGVLRSTFHDKVVLRGVMKWIDYSILFTVGNSPGVLYYSLYASYVAGDKKFPAEASFPSPQF